VCEAAANFDVTETIRDLEHEMLTAANNLEFEKAALLRDQIKEVKPMAGIESGPRKAEPVSYAKGGTRTGKKLAGKRAAPRGVEPF
jgi:excinuclease ABC subunit B